jgi:type IV secretory pathway protease TraF
MAPALTDGEWWLALRTSRIAIGDVVVARSPEPGGRLVVKRAVRRVPEGWWIEGDNVGSTRDSRHFGPVSERVIYGVLIMRYRPLLPLRSARSGG